ncbi:GNAT family N-acetyltransferase [Hymenobacter psychrotolerans]|uniref:Acetyltransferase (GNAT) domain-containing protein n=1 Tax=Hymenobacter psychrotolerans DSM 18569 TaxID=1121959 RepID=A0A1M7GCI5_9BACT|nr:GNAT family N-acetyltransferase [Hymenobacter psychrotolerans]SHM14102.1 Acetyltransferase (GNAT) domain-containing protein [Hymenobacter psychrotolerans DSM 18569]
MSRRNQPVRVEPYTVAHEAAWDALIAASDNGPFLFQRSFLTYHQDRFQDRSWLVWQGTELVAVFVAATASATDAPHTLVAHPGLPYGGLVTVGLPKYTEIEAWLELLRHAWRAAGFRQLLLKPVPRVFCRRPSDVLPFWLYQQDARLSARELNSVIDLTQPFRIGTWRRGNLRKARRNGVAVEPTAALSDFAAFWQILADNLQHAHGRQPVHTLAEIRNLHSRNPGGLELWVARVEAEVVAGVLVFQDVRQGFVHAQYIAGSPLGKQTGAVDAILAELLRVKQGPFQRFSFGISTVRGEVNYGLLNQKEGFGATAETTDTYTLNL